MLRNISAKWWIVLFGLAAGLFVGVSLALDLSKQVRIGSFEDCKQAGYPILESYPEQCIANGETFTNPDQTLQ